MSGYEIQGPTDITPGGVVVLSLTYFCHQFLQEVEEERRTSRLSFRGLAKAQDATLQDTNLRLKRVLLTHYHNL